MGQNIRQPPSQYWHLQNFLLLWPRNYFPIINEISVSYERTLSFLHPLNLLPVLSVWLSFIFLSNRHKIFDFYLMKTFLFCYFYLLIFCVIFSEYFINFLSFVSSQLCSSIFIERSLIFKIIFVCWTYFSLFYDILSISLSFEFLIDFPFLLIKSCSKDKLSLTTVLFILLLCILPVSIPWKQNPRFWCDFYKESSTPEKLKKNRYSRKAWEVTKEK